MSTAAAFPVHQSPQLEVQVSGVVRGQDDSGHVNGWKRNKLRGDGRPVPFTVHFRRGRLQTVDGADRPHSRLVMEAATHAWNRTDRAPA